MKYCRKEDDVFYHTVMTKTKRKTNAKTKKKTKKVHGRPNICYIFEKQKVQGYRCSDFKDKFKDIYKGKYIDI